MKEVASEASDSQGKDEVDAKYVMSEITNKARHICNARNNAWICCMTVDSNNLDRRPTGPLHPSENYGHLGYRASFS